MKIDFYFKKAFPLKNRVKIKSLIKFIFKNNEKKAVAVDIIFCSDTFLLAINQKFLNHNTFTDIITFNLGHEGEIIGELYISVDRVQENALKFKVLPEKEIHRVIIHGILHLIGMKDKSSTEKKKMRYMEDYYLSMLEQFHVKR